jgi:hypothetical protein
MSSTRPRASNATQSTVSNGVAGLAIVGLLRGALRAATIAAAGLWEQAPASLLVKALQLEKRLKQRSGPGST